MASGDLTMQQRDEFRLRAADAQHDPAGADPRELAEIIERYELALEVAEGKLYLADRESVKVRQLVGACLNIYSYFEERGQERMYIVQNLKDNMNAVVGFLPAAELKADTTDEQ